MSKFWVRDKNVEAINNLKQMADLTLVYVEKSMSKNPQSYKHQLDFMKRRIRLMSDFAEVSIKK